MYCIFYSFITDVRLPRLIIYLLTATDNRPQCSSFSFHCILKTFKLTFPQIISTLDSRLSTGLCYSCRRYVNVSCFVRNWYSVMSECLL